MSLKKVNLTQVEAQFAQWSECLDAMRVRLEKSEIEGRLAFHQQVDASQRQLETRLRHLEELKRSGEAAWCALKAGVESALKELSSSINGEAK
jgi:hypothetical protein